MDFNLKYFRLLMTFLLINFLYSSALIAEENIINKNALRTGFTLEIFPDIKRVDMEVALSYWSDKLSKQIGISASVYIYKDIKEMRRALEQDKINCIVSSPLAIIENFDLQQLTDGYKVYSDGSTTEDLLVVTRKDSHINKVKDFKNKHLSLLMNDKLSSIFVNTLTLDHSKLQANKLFKRIDYVDKSAQLIYKLFFKQTDIILIYQQAYKLALELNPQIKQSTQIIYKLPKMHRGIGFFHKRVPANFRNHVITELENIHLSYTGQQLLTIFLTDQLKRSTVSDLNSVIELKQRYDRLMESVQ